MSENRNQVLPARRVPMMGTTCGIAHNGVALDRSRDSYPLDVPNRVVLEAKSVNTEMLVGPLEILEGVRTDVDWSALERREVSVRRLRWSRMRSIVLGSVMKATMRSGSMIYLRGSIPEGEVGRWMRHLHAQGIESVVGGLLVVGRDPGRRPVCSFHQPLFFGGSGLCTEITASAHRNAERGLQTPSTSGVTAVSPFRGSF